MQMEATMTHREAIRELARLRFCNGYTFENGTPFCETLGEKRAADLLDALYTVATKETEAPLEDSQAADKAFKTAPSASRRA